MVAHVPFPGRGQGSVAIADRTEANCLGHAKIPCQPLPEAIALWALVDESLAIATAGLVFARS